MTYRELAIELNNKGDIFTDKLDLTEIGYINVLKRKGYVTKYGRYVLLNNLIPINVSYRKLGVLPVKSNKLATIEYPNDKAEFTMNEHFYLLQRDGYDGMTTKEIEEITNKSIIAIWVGIHNLVNNGWAEFEGNKLYFIEELPHDLKTHQKATKREPKVFKPKVLNDISMVKSMAKEFEFNITKILYDSLNFVNNLC